MATSLDEEPIAKKRKATVSEAIELLDIPAVVIPAVVIETKTSVSSSPQQKQLVEAVLKYRSGMSILTEMELVKITEGSYEYNRVYNGIQQSLTQNITKIEKIQNPYLWGCYLLKKEEYKHRGIQFNELTLYHETARNNVDSIARNNFDWRKSGSRAKYGKGVSFSYFANYAHQNSSYRGVMLVVSVLVGKATSGYWQQQLPGNDYDTTTSGGSNCNVYVKYSDHEFYPEYIVYF